MREWRRGQEAAQIKWLAVPFGVAVIFNYPWELAHSPLYIGCKSMSWKARWWHCFVASLGDGLIVLLIYLLGWATLRCRDWFERPSVRGCVLMLVAGLAMAISIEWVAVYIIERWKYTPQMPLLPGLGVGITPVAQMLLLPPLIFRVVAAWRRRALRQGAA